MDNSPLTIAEKEAIRKYFGKTLEELDQGAFRKLLKQLRSKYHPDNFERFEDETVKEMATDRFQMIERLAQKMEYYFQGKLPDSNRESRIFHPDAQFAFDKLKIEVNTTDKDLKYHLFGTYYRWLLYGHSFKIPETKASIIIDEEHRGHRIGYRETIRMYLTFGVKDAVEDIVNWLYERIAGRATSLIIHGDVVEIDRNEMLRAVKKTTFKQIGPGK